MLLEAIQDRRLCGESLVSPLKKCLGTLNTPCIKPIDALQKGAAAIAMVPATALAAAGIFAKWIDLKLRMDQFAHKGPAIAYWMPYVQEKFSRLGDHLVAHLHAKYIADQFDIPFYCRPFKGSEYFAFSRDEPLKDKLTEPLYFRKVVHLKSKADIEALAHIDKQKSVLYLLPYFPESPIEKRGQEKGFFIKYDVDWKSFKLKMKQSLAVIEPHKLVPIPESSYSIGLHVRTGGSFDPVDASTLWPAKLPPLSYYIGELEHLLASSLVPKDKGIFIHIFTDDEHPKNLRERIAEELSRKGLFPDFQGQKVTLNYTEHPRLVDDIANMTRFQCMIRPDSNLSGTLAKVADSLQIEIAPSHFQVNPEWTQIAIDQTETTDASGTEVRQTNYTREAVKRFPTVFYRFCHKMFY